MAREERMVELDRVYLFSENPRHPPLDSQSEIISQLCKHEQVLPLARDIVRNGLNPLERFALVLDENSDGSDNSAYIVAEGNRRICALKLLKDPALAPPDKRRDFEKLAQGWSAVTDIPATIFHENDDLDLWLDRTHQGEQGGIGRKNWNAEQKQRHSGDAKNRTAQAILDYAEEAGLLNADDRKRKITTVQRFVGNPLVRDALGLVITNPNEVQRNRDEADFKLLMKKFMGDLTADKPKIHSRANREEISAYARELSGTPGQTRNTVDAQPLKAETQKTRRDPRPKKPRKLEQAQFVPFDVDVNGSIDKLHNRKLSSLYTSICSVSLPEHVPLIAVGVWSFFETLTARAGRSENDSFNSFFSNDRLSRYGYPKGESAKVVRAALERIAAFGNTTKHHESSAHFSGNQLANDVETLRKIIIACADEALAKGP